MKLFKAIEMFIKFNETFIKATDYYYVLFYKEKLILSSIFYFSDTNKK